MSSPPGEGLLFRERDIQRGASWLPGETEHELANRNHGERGASKFGSLLHHRLAANIFLHPLRQHAYIATTVFCWLLGKDAPFLRKPSLTVPKQASPGLCHCFLCRCFSSFLPLPAFSHSPQGPASTGHNREKSPNHKKFTPPISSTRRFLLPCHTSESHSTCYH